MIWFSFLAQSKDSLWGLDLLRCESNLLRSHWVMLVKDVLTGGGTNGAPSDKPNVRALMTMPKLLQMVDRHGRVQSERERARSSKGVR